MTNTEVDKEGRYVPVSAIAIDLRQFERLRKLEPPLTIEEIAHRMAWPKRDVEWLMRKYKENIVERRGILAQHIEDLHERHPDWTYRQIAEHLGTTRSTVAGVVSRYKYRKKLEAAE